MTYNDHMRPQLTVDLAAIGANYRQLTHMLGSIPCAAVVKADCYGLGMARIAPAIAQAGCQRFFVATLEEALELRTILPNHEIGVFQGIFPEEEKVFEQHRLIPVLNDSGQIALWAKWAASHAWKKAIIHIDTGMSRLGLTRKEVNALHEERQALRPVELLGIMSHLACADEPQHPLNEKQRLEFAELAAMLPQAPWGLANSSGIFLGAAYHFDWVRSGAAIYGVNPTPYAVNPMRRAVTLTAPVLQIREIDRAGTTGYGATREIQAGARLATLAIGYADGLFRMLGNKMRVFAGDKEAQVLGRVSMDMLCVDVTHLPEVKPGDSLEILGVHQDADGVMQPLSGIGYEIFVRLGARLERHYVGEPA